MVIVKINSAGTALIYFTYLSDSFANRIAMDAAGDAFVTGSGRAARS